MGCWPLMFDANDRVISFYMLSIAGCLETALFFYRRGGTISFVCHRAPNSASRRELKNRISDRFEKAILSDTLSLSGATYNNMADLRSCHENTPQSMPPVIFL